jgi:hypothetical protein
MHPETAMALATIRQSDLRRLAANHRPTTSRPRFRPGRSGRPTRTQGAR